MTQRARASANNVFWRVERPPSVEHSSLSPKLLQLGKKAPQRRQMFGTVISQKTVRPDAMGDVARGEDRDESPLP
jgi:hypothetical protein